MRILKAPRCRGRFELRISTAFTPCLVAANAWWHFFGAVGVGAVFGRGDWGLGCSGERLEVRVRGVGI